MYPHQATQRVERIDGIDLVVGSLEHSEARRIRDHRMDEAYVAAHEGDLRRHYDALRVMLGHRLDANQTAFIARDLLYVRREIEKTIYDTTRAAEFVPVDTEIPRGAQSYATRIMDERGTARISHTLSSDPPRADVALDEDVAKLVNIEGAYAYTVRDLEYAAFSGSSLPRDKAEACAMMIARGLDQVGRIGHAASGLTGFFNDANVPTVTLTNGEWLTATAAEILADLAQIEAAVISQSRDQHAVEDLILPTVYEGRLRTVKADTTSDLSVAAYFFGGLGFPGTSRMLKRLHRWIALDDATGTDVGVADPPMGIAYSKDPRVLRWPVPIMYEELPVQIRGFEYLVNARALCGGVDFRRPMGAVYIENLD